MQVDFVSTQSALCYGAPLPKERQALEAYANGRINEAETLLDNVIAENPSRIYYINVALLASLPMEQSAKYWEIEAKMKIKAGGSSGLSSSSSNRVSTQPPSYDEAVEQELLKEHLEADAEQSKKKMMQGKLTKRV